jgi:peptidoglycan/LPS O-acetylase OafA/YrhL
MRAPGAAGGGGQGGPPPGEPPPEGGGERPDRYFDKLLKYVPAEAIAFYLPFYEFSKDPESDEWQWIVFAAAILGGFVYLLLRVDKEKKPRRFYYVIALLALLAWTIGTSTVGADLFGLSDKGSKIIVGIAAFALPGVDEALTRFLPR